MSFSLVRAFTSYFHDFIFRCVFFSKVGVLNYHNFQFEFISTKIKRFEDLSLSFCSKIVKFKLCTAMIMVASLLKRYFSQENTACDEISPFFSSTKEQIPSRL